MKKTSPQPHSASTANRGFSRLSRFGFAMVLSLSSMAASAQAIPPASAPPPANAPQRKSSLPDAALSKAREAEKLLAANAPDQAIAILKELDRSYPGQPALSLRLAQVNDTLGHNGYALFYYRRYVQQAGPRAREMAVERVATLELMPGLEREVQKAEKETGEQSRPVATPAPVVKRMLATEAKDGTLVPIRNEADYERYRRQGVPETAGTPMPTPSVTPIVIPPELSVTPTPAPLDAYAQPPAASNSTVAPSGTSAGVRVEPAPRATPAPKTDEDALLAQAFAKAASPSEMTTATDPAPQGMDPAPVMATSTIDPASVPEGQAAGRIDLAPKVTAEFTAMPTPPSRSAALPRQAPVSPHLSPATAPAYPVAFTQATPAYDSAKAAGFFKVTAGQGNQALVSLLNEIPQSIITISITPQDDRPVISAILTSKEQKRVYVPPGTYDVTANVATTDYSPITLMNSQFSYTFTAGRQYTRRFNKTNIQQLN